MSNVTNFSIKTRDNLKQWIMRKLGYPLVEVELTEDHVEDAIDEAVEEFTRYFIGDKKYLGLDLSTYVQDVGFTLPEGSTGIFDLSDGDASINSASQGINTLFSVQNVMWNFGMIPNFTGGSTGSWVTYELAMQYIDNIKRFTGGGFDYNYNSTNRVLTLTPDPVREGMKGWICIGVHFVREDDQQYGETWVKRYSLALCKETLGVIRSKIEGAQLLGGGRINTSIKEEGANEKEKLRTELEATYKPISVFVM